MADWVEVARERDRLRALLKQAHDRDKWQGEFPTIRWCDEVARYFKGQAPSDLLSDKRCEDHATRDPSKPCCRAKP